MDALARQLKRWTSSLIVLVEISLWPTVVFGGTVKKINEAKDQAVLRFDRKVVRDLYEADIITIRMSSSNSVINVAIVEKRAMQVRVTILPNQDLEGLEVGAEFVFVEDNRQPSHLVFAQDAGDTQLAESSLLGVSSLIGYRMVQAGSSSYSSEFGYGLGLHGLYRAFASGGFGVDIDAYRAAIDFPEANQSGEFSQRRTKFYFNLAASERISVGGDLTLQNASRDILNKAQDGTVNTDYISNQFGATINYRGYNWNAGVRYRNRGTLRLRTQLEDGPGRDVEPFNLSSQYGLDYWTNDERSSATYFRLSYFKFENMNGEYKPVLFERINFYAGYERFLNAQRSMVFDVEKLAPHTPDQFGVLRQTSTINFSFGINSIFARDYNFLTGLNLGYGADNAEFVKGETIEERKFTEMIFAVMAKLEYNLR